MEEKEAPIKKPAIWAKQCYFLTKIALAICLLEGLAIIFCIYVPNKLSESFGLFSTVGFLFLVPILAICFGGGIIALISLLVTKNRQKTPYRHCLLSIFFGSIIPLSLMILTAHITYLNRQRSLLLMCQENLVSLCNSVRSYEKSEDIQRISVDIWSDELSGYFGDNIFCRADSNHANGSSYAMNENIVELTALSDNIVLFFESDLGWNGRGGADDVVTDRHGENKPGAHIAFADGHVEFVEADKIPTLRWTID